MRTIIHAMALAFHPGGNIRPQAPVYGRFTEGFDTADLRAARTLLSSVG